MSAKLFSKATLTAIAIAVVASTASIGSAQAGGYFGGHGWHGHSHGYNYHVKHCFWKKKKVWSHYYGYYVWKKFRVCH